MRKNKILPTWVTLIIVLAFLGYKNDWLDRLFEKEVPEQTELFLKRDPSLLVYSKHAKCRMECRNIEDSEVAEILLNGTINYDKTEMSERGNMKYALEGRSKDNQKIRLIVAPEDNKLVVVTVIDLEKDWKCDC